MGASRRSARAAARMSCAASSRSTRTQAAAAAGRDVRDRGPAGFPSLALARPFLVDRARRDLFRLVLPRASLEKSLLDVFVLAFALVAPGTLWHLVKPPSFLALTTRRQIHSTVRA